jgi:hypothetical protein
LSGHVVCTGESRNGNRILFRPKRKKLLKNLGANGRIILKLVIKSKDKIGTSRGLFYYSDNGPSGTITGGEFV